MEPDDVVTGDRGVVGGGGPAEGDGGVRDRGDGRGAGGRGGLGVVRGTVAVDGGLLRGLGDAVDAVEDAFAPVAEPARVEVDRQVEDRVGVAAPGPGQVAESELLGGGRHGVLVGVAVLVGGAAELADDNGQSGVDERVQVVGDLLGGVEDAVHVDGEDQVAGGVRVVDGPGVGAHDALPVLAPVGRVHHERVLESGGAQLLDRGDGRFGPAGGVGVAPGLVADVDDDVVLLAGQHVLEADPVVGGVVEGAGRGVLAVSGGVVHLQDADQPVGLALLDDGGHVLGAVLAPAVSVRQDDPDAVGTQRLDVRERLRFAGVPGVRVVDPAHDEVVAVALQQPAPADVQAHRLRAGRLDAGPGSGRLGRGRPREEGAGDHQPDQGGEPGQQAGGECPGCGCIASCCAHGDSRRG